MAFEELETLSSPDSEEAFTAALYRTCIAVGAVHFLAVRLRGAKLEHVVQVMHNAPAPEMVDGMRHWSLVRLLDSVRASAIPLMFGVGASPAPDVVGYSSGVAAIAREPRGAVVIVFGCRFQAVPPERVMPMVQATLLAAHHAVSGMRQLHAASCPFSERELQCLQLAFTGELSSREIGQALEISARTVEHYLKQARARLGVDSTLAAGVLAVNQGWMELPDGGPIEITG